MYWRAEAEWNSKFLDRNWVGVSRSAAGTDNKRTSRAIFASKHQKTPSSNHPIDVFFSTLRCFGPTQAVSVESLLNGTNAWPSNSTMFDRINQCIQQSVKFWQFLELHQFTAYCHMYSADVICVICFFKEASKPERTNIFELNSCTFYDHWTSCVILFFHKLKRRVVDGFSNPEPFFQMLFLPAQDPTFAWGKKKRMIPYVFQSMFLLRVRALLIRTTGESIGWGGPSLNSFHRAPNFQERTERLTQDIVSTR